MLLHRQGGDPLQQETIRIWDSGARLVPSGQPVYLGQVANEVLVQRMGIYSYWSAAPVLGDSIQVLQEEARGMPVKRVDKSMLLLRQP